MIRTLFYLLISSPFLFADEVKTQSDAEGELETVVTARKPLTAASEATVRDRDLKLRPVKRPADILTVTPGLFVVQHAGGGKANQYFLRGFDADHGTDVAISVDGIPINLVSHGHGQGYTDLNWLIPELVDRVEVHKGTYYGFLGDFATAGGINLVTRNNLKESRGWISGGMFSTLRVGSMAGADIDGWRPLLAIDAYYTDGPFIRRENTARYSFFGKVTKDLSKSSSLTFGATAYSGTWNASGQIPTRAVNAGTITRFGFIDPNEGGLSKRASLFASYRNQIDEESELETMLYFVNYNLSLFSNFTFFKDDTTNGDMINQTDQRNYFGGDTKFRVSHKILDVPSESTIGLQFRHDGITNSLRRAPRRIHLVSLAESDVSETSLSAYFTDETSWFSWLRTVGSLRLDTFWFNVKDRLADADRGSKTAGQVSPKVSVIVSPLNKTDIFLNAGLGFHSNDARGVTAPTSAASPLARAASYEVGSRTNLIDGRLDLAASAFLIDLDSELVFVGDDGTTNAKGRSRRTGIELEARLRLLSWLYLDTDFTLNDARFRDLPEGANYVPYAPTRLWGGGLSAQHPEGYFGRIGFFHVAERPAKEDNTFRTQGFMRFDTTAGYRHTNWEMSLTLQNTFDTEWREAQFLTDTQLQGETVSTEEIHFTPGAPINIQGSLTYYF